MFPPSALRLPVLRQHAPTLWSLPKSRCSWTRRPIVFSGNSLLSTLQMQNLLATICSKSTATHAQWRLKRFAWVMDGHWTSSPWWSWVHGLSGFWILAAFGGCFVDALPLKPCGLSSRNSGNDFGPYTHDTRCLNTTGTCPPAFRTFHTRMKAVDTNTRQCGFFHAMGPLEGAHMSSFGGERTK